MAMTALCSEILDQLDLLIGEWSHLLSKDGDCTDQLVVLKHRNGNYGSNTAEFCTGDEGWIALCIKPMRRYVRNLGDLPSSGDATKR